MSDRPQIVPEEYRPQIMGRAQPTPVEVRASVEEKRINAALTLIDGEIDCLIFGETVMDEKGNIRDVKRHAYSPAEFLKVVDEKLLSLTQYIYMKELLSGERLVKYMRMVNEYFIHAWRKFAMYNHLPKRMVVKATDEDIKEIQKRYEALCVGPGDRGKDRGWVRGEVEAFEKFCRKRWSKDWDKFDEIWRREL